MKPNHVRFTILAITLLAGAWLPTASAQLPRELIEEALDQNIAELDIPTTTLAEALMTLADKTGLQFGLTDDVLALMPRGDQTRIAISIKHSSVREAVGQVFEGLGLRMSIDGDKIVLDAAEFVLRVGRSLTTAELQTIQLLASGSWSKIAAGRDAPRIDVRSGGNPSDELARKVTSAVERSQHPMATRQFDDAGAQLGLTWRIDGNVVIFETRRDEIRRRLDRLVDLTYQREPLDRVLVDLARRADVTMQFEPGVLQRVVARERSVDLLQRGTSIRQTLERICGSTGLAYEVLDDGVRVYLPSSSPAGQPTTAQLARVSIEVRPGVHIDVFVPLDQLPSDLRSEAERKIRELLAVPAAAKP
ncbi:MAG: hypothetical protein ACKVS9_01765 [Phycisphaerae bacterium]